MTDYTTPPEHTFLTAREVFARYRWGRSKGYLMISASDFPRPISGAYRLDTLIAWEERQLREAETKGVDPHDGRVLAEPPNNTQVEVVDLPRRRRTRGQHKEQG